MTDFSLTDNFLCFQIVCDLEKGLGGYMLAGESGHLVLLGTGRQGTNTVGGVVCQWAMGTME